MQIKPLTSHAMVIWLSPTSVTSILRICASELSVVKVIGEHLGSDLLVDVTPFMEQTWTRYLVLGLSSDNWVLKVEGKLFTTRQNFRLFQIQSICR